MEISKLLAQIESILGKNPKKEIRLLDICRVLYENIEHYNWVGFYFIRNGRLILGPYMGEPTTHTNIGIGEGICGQAAEQKKIFIVQDVSKENNYLSCSPKVKSEIVIPIKKNDKIVGELDIDSHYKNIFTEKDITFLNTIVKKIEKFL